MGTHNSFAMARAPNTYNTVNKCHPPAKQYSFFITSKHPHLQQKIKEIRRRQKSLARIENLPLFLVMKHELYQA